MEYNRVYYTGGVCLLAGFMAFAARHPGPKPDAEANIAVMQEIQQDAGLPLNAGVMAEMYQSGTAEVMQKEELVVAAAGYAVRTEAKIYSFLQGPKSWGQGRAWSGEWSNEYVRGGYFGNFGCGLCCMANIYSTFTDYECSPLDMYEYAREVSGYAPSKNAGAIGWDDMKMTLQKSGFDGTLCEKPDDYEAFRSQIADAKGAVILVCSSNDDTYWESTRGHYVNIWLYDEERDEVFLSDPGSPDRNRSRIPLRYAYDALKTSSQYQYLLIQGYSEEDNLWKKNGIDEAWVEPDLTR